MKIRMACRSTRAVTEQMPNLSTLEPDSSVKYEVIIESTLYGARGYIEFFVASAEEMAKWVPGKVYDVEFNPTQSVLLPNLRNMAEDEPERDVEALKVHVVELASGSSDSVVDP